MLRITFCYETSYFIERSQLVSPSKINSIFSLSGYEIVILSLLNTSTRSIGDLDLS